MLPLPETSTATRRNIAPNINSPGFRTLANSSTFAVGTTSSKLTEAGIAGDKVRWADPLCEGPLHHHATIPRGRRNGRPTTRRFVESDDRDLPGADGDDWRVDQCVHYDETMLWFEADLFDQMILVYLLSRLGRFRTRTRLSLICIGEFPGVDRLIGLGQLSPGQLATLLPGRRQVTPGQIRLADRTWDALREDNPVALAGIGRMRSRALPFFPRRCAATSRNTPPFATV